ncbi:Endoplasmic reticulum-Golgi intermediate compartment protein 1 [Hypsibius exemplaris]|uniref:Endoplasmic reticulum-Golgi intermediate compartment protein 1 n=1 Tax=Hypsibius exemplaris TaxID=2072580 RepID=A0A1W0XEM9_HYPEX|nr:Endoplasmic reticulum-Golgi intermediate compartment protein 1 [Hypsibius exemplaris]
MFDLRRLDIYRKVPKDLTQPTLTGALISVFCVLFIVFLLISEFLMFITPEIQSELFVDDPNTHHDRIPVRLNLTMPHTKCDILGLDIQDNGGRHEVGHTTETSKIPVDGGAGCRFETVFSINQVPGNFHVSTHAAGVASMDQINFQHIVHELEFGHSLGAQRNKIPGSYNAITSVIHDTNDPTSNHEYIIKIVPTIYEDLKGKKLAAYQYTYAYKGQPTYGQMIPAIWFKYDLTPITVKYMESRAPFYTFLTTICAIVGGTFTVAGIIDALTFSASEMLRKKLS